jgi:hypothetical protein
MQRNTRLGYLGAATAAIAISVAAVAPVAATTSPDLASHVHFMPIIGATAQADGQASGQAKNARPGGNSAYPQAGINYHGGRIVAQDFHVVSIYWSSGATYPGGPNPNGAELTGSGAADGSLVGTFLRGLGGSPYYNINKTYWDQLTAGVYRSVTGGIVYDGYWADGTNAPSGTDNVSGAAVEAEIAAGFASGALTYGANTIYSVFSAGGVNLGGGAFTQYCAYHGHFTWSGNDVIYAVMPYNAYNTSACGAQATGPNGDPADFEVNTLAHEIEEANTDPSLSAWWDNRGYENADKCAWTFGTTSTASNGAKYNMTIGGKNWLVQRNWKNSGSGSCALS